MLYSLVKSAKIPVMVCADRYKAGLEAVSRYSCNILLMDDGLQNGSLKKDFTLAVVDGRRGFGKFCERRLAWR